MSLLRQAQNIKSVYKEVAEFYDETGLAYEPTSVDRRKFWFDAMSKDRPISKKIDAIYRYKGGSRQGEYTFYQETWIGTDFRGNEISWEYIVGRVDIPVAHKEFVPEENAIVATSVDRFDRKYEIPFNEKNIKAIEHMFTDDTKYYVTDGSRTYGGDMSQIMFVDWSYDDLIYFYKTGMKPGTQLITPDTAEAAKKLDEQSKRSR
jgi:hypothetical protein